MVQEEKIHIVTVATKSKGYLPVLDQQVKENGLILTKLAQDKEYKGHYMKDLEMMDYLRNVPKNDIVIFLDGFDTLMLAEPEEVIRKFKNFDTKLLLSIENIGGLSFIHDAVFERIDGHYLNSGLYMGYAGFMLKFLEDMYKDEYDKKSNQKTWMRHLNRLKTVNKLEGIKFDTASDVFLNHSFSTNNYPILKEKRIILYDSKPCFIQGNGREDMTYIIKATGHNQYDLHRNEYYYEKAKYNTKAVFKTYPIISYYVFLGIILAFVFGFLTYRRYRNYKSKYFYI
jgi:hypothetical protein